MGAGEDAMPRLITWSGQRAPLGSEEAPRGGAASRETLKHLADGRAP